MPPQTQETPATQPEIRPFFSPENHHVYGIAALALLAVASFFLVFAYMGAGASSSEQTAAAASAPSPFEALSITAKAAIVVDLTSGNVLYEKNADAQLPLASLTKIPLALVVSEVLSPDERITIPFDTAFTEGAQRLLTGEVWKARDVLHFTLIASSNEGAQILAAQADTRLFALYPSSTPEQAALWRMNDLARSLGLTNTYFLNVSGLDESETQSGAYGTARDMATLLKYAAAARPEVFAGTVKDELLLTDASGQTTVAFNTNEILGQIPGLILGKTGYTDLAGGNLAIVFDAGLSQPIAAVVLGSTYEGRFSDMRSLVETARAAIALQ